MKKTLTLLACLVMAMSISARSYVAVADTGYVAPGDTAEVTDPITPPIIDEGEVVDTTSQKEFTLNAEKVKLRVGETFQLSIIWNDPEWAAANSKQIYYYCNSDVASVSEEGLITARRAGEASVSVYANGISHECSVVVDEGEPGVVQHRGRMTLPLGEFLDGEGNEFEVTLTDGIMRLTGSFWGHACIPSELEYEILDGAAFFNIYTSYEDSTCTDGWQGSFMVRQTIDVSFENCTSDVYNVYVSNVHYEVYEEGAMNAIVYRAAPNRYGTDTNVNLNLEGETQALTAEIGEESIHITGYCYSNCGMGLYCVAEEQDGSIALTFYEVGVIGATCMGNHYVDFTIPRLAEQVDEIYAYGPYDPSARFEVKMQGNTSVTTILKETITPYYDLTGRKVARPTRGIYIKDGRKVIIR
ncbi:MAG: Ig-like domain-containing protein [Bacteroidaceae bacterium]|nr:Ig-like domain-containing protein [Bacteroidaceae bacterium]